MNTWLTGLTSVTFRGRTAEEVIQLAGEAGLAGIEWGGDIHVPPGDTEQARRIGAATRAAGLRVLSYGSYFRLCAQPDARAAFAPVLAAAVALGAAHIRVWAGDRPPEEADDAYAARAAAELAAVIAMAATAGITVGTEFHRGTLTQTAAGACRLLEAAGPRAGTYWQPNPEQSPDANAAELARVAPRLSHIHVFQWDAANRRLPLAAGAAAWCRYLAGAVPVLPQAALLLEFVRDDDPQAFREDARTLLAWNAGHNL